MQFLYSQDPPLGFDYNQGTAQGFYYFLNMSIDDQSLDEDDWIGAFKKYDESQGGECIGDDINTDETLGGMCTSSPNFDNNGDPDGTYDYFCLPGFPDCDQEAWWQSGF